MNDTTIVGATVFSDTVLSPFLHLSICLSFVQVLGFEGNASIIIREKAGWFKIIILFASEFFVGVAERCT